jgi:cysteine desulfurase/selenocysteine lyase
MPLGLSASEVSPGDTAPSVHSGVPDPSMIARMANAFFQMTPNQTAVGADPGVPVAPPSPAFFPAPNVVTTAAPFAPANPLVGPPDLPPSTIPSIVPTPNLTAPHAPSQSALPPGYGEPPLPGASTGSVGPAAPFGLGDTAHLVPEAHRSHPLDGGGSKGPSDGAYFLAETAFASAPVASTPAPAAPGVAAAPQAAPATADRRKAFHRKASPRPRPITISSNSTCGPSPRRRAAPWASRSTPRPSSATSRSCKSASTAARNWSGSTMPRPPKNLWR